MALVSKPSDTATLPRKGSNPSWGGTCATLDTLSTLSLIQRRCPTLWITRAVPIHYGRPKTSLSPQSYETRVEWAALVRQWNVAAVISED
jgi:hypothetical protein